MKLSRALGLAGVGIGAAGIAFGIGCSSSKSTGSTGDQCDQNPSCLQPPKPPTSGGTSVTASHNYAMHKLYLGDTDRSGVSNANAWKSFGYDLDNKITAKESTDVCNLAAGASKTTQVDGTGGIDNSFGENILPIVITTAGQDASKKINDGIQSGSFSVLTPVVGFDDSSPNQTATGLTGVLLAGGKYGSPTAGAPDGGASTQPSWDSNTHWPVRPELLNCPGSNCPAGTDPIAAAKIKFAAAYVVNGLFVNGTPGNLDLSLTVGGQTLDIAIHSAVITFQQQAKGSVSNGTIAGVINTEELITSLKTVAGHISTSLCQGSAFESIAQQIRQASDIRVESDGSVDNPSGQDCNGISIGLGFDGTEIAMPTKDDVTPPTAAAPDPCAADAGSD